MRQVLLTLTALVAGAGCTHGDPKEDPKITAPTTEDKPRFAGMVLPPEEAGAFRTSVAGCAATPDQAPVQTRAALPAESVEASGIATGLVITHELPHACCLVAKTQVEVVGDHVTVTESMEGTACRCRCSSSLRTAIGLRPGTYSVDVKSAEAGKTRSAWSGTVQVR